MNLVNFTPRPGANVGLAATTTSGGTAKLICNDLEVDLMVYNLGTVDIAFQIAGASVTAAFPTTSANGDTIAPAGTLQVIRGVRGTGAGIYAAALTSTGTGSLFIQPGSGS